MMHGYGLNRIIAFFRFSSQMIVVLVSLLLNGCSGSSPSTPTNSDQPTTSTESMICRTMTDCQAFGQVCSNQGRCVNATEPAIVQGQIGLVPMDSLPPEYFKSSVQAAQKTDPAVPPMPDQKLRIPAWFLDYENYEGTRIMPNEILLHLQNHRLVKIFRDQRRFDLLGIKLRYIEEMPFNWIRVTLDRATFVAATRLDEIARKLRTHPAILHTALNRIVEKRGIVPTPNDPYFAYDWHIQAIDVPHAWEMTNDICQDPKRQLFVGIVDSGIVTHPDIVGQMIPLTDLPGPRPELFQTILTLNTGRDTSFDYLGYDFGNQDANPTDREKPADGRFWVHHGLWVAGTIAATTNNAYGVASLNGWGSCIKIISAKGGVDFEDGLPSSAITQAIAWVAGDFASPEEGVPSIIDAIGEPVNVINISLGGPCFGNPESDPEAFPIRAANEKGIAVVISSGNGTYEFPSYGINIDLYKDCPASIDPDRSVVVSASEWDQSHSNWSNFGSPIDFHAPGGTKIRGVNLFYEPTLDEYQVTTDWGGTSASAPNTTAVIAMMKSVYAHLGGDPFDISGLFINQHRAEMVDPSLTYPSPPNVPLCCGAGLINARQSICLAYRLAEENGYITPLEIPELCQNSLAEIAPRNIEFQPGQNRQLITIQNPSFSQNLVVSAEVEDGAGMRIRLDPGLKKAVIYPGQTMKFWIETDDNQLPSGIFNAQLLFTVETPTREEIPVFIRKMKIASDILIRFTPAGSQPTGQASELRVAANTLPEFALTVAPGTYRISAETVAESSDDPVYIGSYAPNGQPQLLTIGPGDLISGMQLALFEWQYLAE